MNLNYTKVQHFLTIVKYMNMNKAAEELYITQPALSLSISRLEEELGVTLFYREKNKLILSKEAKTLLPRFQQLQTDYENLSRETEALLTPFQEPFITISFTGSQYFFLALYMTGILNRFDKAITKLCYVDMEQATKMLLSDQIAFAISCPQIKHPRATTVTLLTEPIGLVLPASHPMAGRKEISLEELENIAIHGLSKSNAFRQLCDRICQTQGIGIHYATENDIAAYNKRITMHDDTHGFLATPANYEWSFKNLGDYVYLPVAGNILSRKMGITYLSDSDVQYKYADFIEMLKKNIDKLNADHHVLGQSIMGALQKL